MPTTLDEWLSLLEGRHHTAIDLGLDRCREVWHRMGKPVPGGRIFVVAGTNGKGSTVATICSLIGALGFRYGCYTTPHIHRYNERVQINGQNASDELIIESFKKVEAALGDVSLSYFEFGTLGAFQLLSEQGLDFAVMEVGLGGRLDAVNLLDADCAVITPIGLDHQDYLGENLESIGHEKAGIIRGGRPLVCGQAEPPYSVLEKASRLNAPVQLLGRDFSIEREAGHSLFCWADRSLHLPLPVLRGEHQLNNAATGLAAVLQLLPAAIEQPEALSRGLASVDLKGRFEQVGERPDIWIDVGHNPLGAAVIAQTLRKRGAGEGRRIRCVLAMLADKDAEAVAAELQPVIHAWYCGGLSGDRGQSGHDLGRRVAGVVDPGRVSVFDSVEEALCSALDDSEPEDGVLVFGSFHTADEADRMMLEFQTGHGAKG